jgi:hypothetical protein
MGVAAEGGGASGAAAPRGGKVGGKMNILNYVKKPDFLPSTNYNLLNQKRKFTKCLGFLKLFCTVGGRPM